VKENTIFRIDNFKNVLVLGSSLNLSILYRYVQDLGLNFFVITSPDQEAEIEEKVPYKVFEKLDKHFIEFIQNRYHNNCTLFISLGSRWIFDSNIINLMGGNLVNFHCARLPFDAGGGGFSWRILKKDRINTQLVHLVDSGIDTGPIITSYSSIFPSDCRIPQDFESYHLKSFEKFFMKFISSLIKGESFSLKHQPNYIGSYYPRLETSINSWINWSWDSDQIVDFINAFDSPYKGASTYINNIRVRIRNVQLHGGELPSHPYMSGIISRKQKRWIVISTSDKFSLIVENVEIEDGSNIIDSLYAGDRFYTDSDTLLESMTNRVKFGSNGILKETK